MLRGLCAEEGLTFIVGGDFLNLFGREEPPLVFPDVVPDPIRVVVIVAMCQL